MAHQANACFTWCHWLRSRSGNLNQRQACGLFECFIILIRLYRLNGCFTHQRRSVKWKVDQQPPYLLVVVMAHLQQPLSSCNHPQSAFLRRYLEQKILYPPNALCLIWSPWWNNSAASTRANTRPSVKLYETNGRYHSQTTKWVLLCDNTLKRLKLNLKRNQQWRKRILDDPRDLALQHQAGPVLRNRFRLSVGHSIEIHQFHYQKSKEIPPATF